MISSQEEKKLAESYSFLFEEEVDTLYSLAASSADPIAKRNSAIRALEISEENKSREFLKSWGNVFIRELSHGIPAEVQERERTLVSRMTELTTEMENFGFSADSHRSQKQVGSELEQARRDLDLFASDLWSK